MNLEQIKNDYAVSKGYDCWESLMGESSYYDNNVFFNHENEVMILVQIECLKRASENLSLEECGFDGRDYGITNENNIIK